MKIRGYISIDAGMIMLRLWIALACVLAVSLPASAQEYPVFSYTRVVISEARTRIGFLTAVNPDCTPIGFVTVRVTRAPANGKIEVVDTRGFGYWSKENSRSKCNEKTVDGSAIFYTSNAGFKGTDSAEIEAFYASGSSRKHRLKISVR